MPEALRLCRTIIDECSCQAGCPSCVTALPPGVADEELEELLVESNAAVACAASLIAVLLTGQVELPDVVPFEIDVRPGIVPPEPDEDQERLMQRLGNASQILKNKRDRVH